VVSSTDKIVPKENPGNGTVEDDEEPEVEPETKIMEEQSNFDEIIVWGHEALPEDMGDPYVRGTEEWISFAEQV